MRGAELPRHNREDPEDAEEVSALRALLGGIVDYAGLFPPAALDMREAVANYAGYRSSDDAWMLGRFVAPVTRLDELDAALGASGSSGTGWTVSAIAGADIAHDADAIQAFNSRSPAGRRVDTVEAKLETVAAIVNAARVARDGFVVFAEVPVRDDPAELIDAIATAGLNAKIRTGGVAVDAFPRAEHIVRFMARCLERRVPFKATAGLHHPICGEYALTYAADAPRGPMFGFLNLFLAAVALRHGATMTDAQAVLTERDAGAFTITSRAVEWRGTRFTTAKLANTRAQSAVAFGSCSFREPVNDLRSLGYLA